jgi:HD-GYP domain-containing protein (c-di-GMP phosphodiesterase class II)
LSEEEVADICDAALLTSLGKVPIPDSIKNKPGPLNDAEWQIVKTHPVLSARILQEVPSLAHLADVVRHHHETSDGSGYPDGLRGGEVPLPVRVVSMCDAFDILTTQRPYRSALSRNEALRILEGMVFDDTDARVVRVLTMCVGTLT